MNYISVKLLPKNNIYAWAHSLRLWFSKSEMALGHLLFESSTQSIGQGVAYGEVNDITHVPRELAHTHTGKTQGSLRGQFRVKPCGPRGQYVRSLGERMVWVRVAWEG